MPVSQGRHTKNTMTKSRKSTTKALHWVSAAACLAILGFAHRDPATHGKEIFEKRCTTCHTLEADKEGPRLKDVYGRQAGSVSSFHYSEALKKTRIVWDEGTLDKWLKDPDQLVPDNAMAFELDDSGDRRAVIAYLRTLSGK